MDNTTPRAKRPGVSVLELCHVAPSVKPSDSAELTLPLTFLDAFCFKFPPIECLFFYTSDQTLTLMASTVVTKLKHSLSLTLRHYLPLAGTLTWPENSPKPYLLYKPGDTVSFTVAESGAGNFNHLSTNHVNRDASETASLVPALCEADTSASIVAFQVTLFPGEGFCVGISAHHAFLDGKSVAMFMRCWAHRSRFDNDTPLPAELMPFFDRTVVKDPTGKLDTLYLNRWVAKSASGFSKRKVFHHWTECDEPSDLVRCTFELTHKEIDSLKTLNLTPDTLSSFVVVSAHVLTCMVKAMSPEPGNRSLYFIVGADYRPRLDPPVPFNYIGNCAGSHVGKIPASECFGTDGFTVVAEKLRALVKGLDKGVLEGAEKRLEKWGSLEQGSHVISVTWSPKFRVYEADFGFGKPKKVEIASVHKKSISLVESSTGGIDGGIEVGLVLKKHEIERFASLFYETLKPLGHE